MGRGAFGFHIFNPLLYIYTHVAPRMIMFLYNRFGIGGILAMPAITLTVEKATYDTLAAARGRDLQEEYEKADAGQGAHGGFPSGGGGLPSWSLLPVRSEADRLVLSFWPFGDPPRGTEAPGYPLERHRRSTANALAAPT
jgi:hypothetical protein